MHCGKSMLRTVLSRGSPPTRERGHSDERLALPPISRSIERGRLTLAGSPFLDAHVRLSARFLAICGVLLSSSVLSLPPRILREQSKERLVGLSTSRSLSFRRKVHDGVTRTTRCVAFTLGWNCPHLLVCKAELWPVVPGVQRRNRSRLRHTDQVYCMQLRVFSCVWAALPRETTCLVMLRPAHHIVSAASQGAHSRGFTKLSKASERQPWMLFFCRPRHRTRQSRRLGEPMKRIPFP